MKVSLPVVIKKRCFCFVVVDNYTYFSFTGCCIVPILFWWSFWRGCNSQ